MNNEQKKEAIKKAIRRIKMGEKTWSPASVKKASKQSIPLIKILTTRKVKMVELDVDIPEKAKQALLSIARKEILKDEKALLSWAFVRGIKNGIELFNKAKK